MEKILLAKATPMLARMHDFPERRGMQRPCNTSRGILYRASVQDRRRGGKVTYRNRCSFPSWPYSRNSSQCSAFRRS